MLVLEHLVKDGDPNEAKGMHGTPQTYGICQESHVGVVACCSDNLGDSDMSPARTGSPPRQGRSKHFTPITYV